MWKRGASAQFAMADALSNLLRVHASGIAHLWENTRSHGAVLGQEPTLAAGRFGIRHNERVSQRRVRWTHAPWQHSSGTAIRSSRRRRTACVREAGRCARTASCAVSRGLRCAGFHSYRRLPPLSDDLACSRAPADALYSTSGTVPGQSPWPNSLDGEGASSLVFRRRDDSWSLAAKTAHAQRGRCVIGSH